MRGAFNLLGEDEASEAPRPEEYRFCGNVRARLTTRALARSPMGRPEGNRSGEFSDGGIGRSRVRLTARPPIHLAMRRLSRSPIVLFLLALLVSAGAMAAAAEQATRLDHHLVAVGDGEAAFDGLVFGDHSGESSAANGLLVNERLSVATDEASEFARRTSGHRDNSYPGITTWMPADAPVGSIPLRLLLCTLRL